MRAGVGGYTVVIKSGGVCGYGSSGFDAFIYVKDCHSLAGSGCVIIVVICFAFCLFMVIWGR